MLLNLCPDNILILSRIAHFLPSLLQIALIQMAYFEVAMICFTVKLKKPVHIQNVSGMLIMYWPRTIKLSTQQQNAKSHTDYLTAFASRFNFPTPKWLFHAKQ